MEENIRQGTATSEAIVTEQRELVSLLIVYLISFAMLLGSLIIFLAIISIGLGQLL